jgi:hypothetical protein
MVRTWIGGAAVIAGLLGLAAPAFAADPPDPYARPVQRAPRPAPPPEPGARVYYGPHFYDPWGTLNWRPYWSPSYAPDPNYRDYDGPGCSELQKEVVTQDEHGVPVVTTRRLRVCH